MSDSLSLLASAIAARPPGGIAGWRAGEAVTHGWLAGRLHAWRALLEQREGRDFALYLEDSLEFAAALLGAWQAGKTVWLCADTLEASCVALGASVDGFLGEFPAAYAPLTPAADTAGVMLPAPSRDIDADAAVLVVHTSGSTGAAQAIAKRLSQLESEVAVLEQLFGARNGDAAVVATVSHQHIYGLLFKVLWPLCAGRPIVAHSAEYPQQLAVLLAGRDSVLVASPAHLKRLPEQLAWQGARSRLRAVYSSGGPLALDTARAVAHLLGTAPVEVYGSSETGGVAWRQRGADGDQAWQAFPNVEWRLAGQELLEVRSPHLPDRDWLRLADRVQARGDGRFELLGRSDRVVKIEEKRISLDRIEAGLQRSPLVDEARVLLCAAAGQREMLAAFVVLAAEGRALLAAEGKLALNRRLRAALAGVAAAVALPRRWRYLEQLPLNAQGKTTHAALLALLAPDAAQPQPDAQPERPRQPHLRELERGTHAVRLELAVPPDLLYFDGHFAGAPILPGVVQLDWAIAYGRRYFALPPHFRGVAALKFQHVIQPGDTVQLELLHDAAKGTLNFRYQSSDRQHASGRVLFDAADN